MNGDYYRKNGIEVLGHTGIDLRAGHGQPVFAAHDGLAYYTPDDGKEGHGVVLISNKLYEFQATSSLFKTIYWHLCDPIKEPQYASPVYLNAKPHKNKPLAVKAGDVIGYADNTGLSSGDHLHFALKPVAKGERPHEWWNRKQNNGYFGAIDPMPYLPSTMLPPSVQVALLATKYQAEGNGKIASYLWAIAKVFRLWGE